MLNKEKRIKIIAGLLSLSMILSMVPGCGTDEGKNVKTTGQNQEQNKDKKGTTNSMVYPVINPGNSSSSSSVSSYSSSKSSSSVPTAGTGQTGIGSSSSRSSAVS